MKNLYKKDMLYILESKKTDSPLQLYWLPDYKSLNVSYITSQNMAINVLNVIYGEYVWLEIADIHGDVYYVSVSDVNIRPVHDEYVHDKYVHGGVSDWYFVSWVSGIRNMPVPMYDNADCDFNVAVPCDYIPVRGMLLKYKPITDKVSMVRNDDEKTYFVKSEDVIVTDFGQDYTHSWLNYFVDNSTSEFFSANKKPTFGITHLINFLDNEERLWDDAFLRRIYNFCGVSEIQDVVTLHNIGRGMSTFGHDSVVRSWSVQEIFAHLLRPLAYRKRVAFVKLKPRCFNAVVAITVTNSVFMTLDGRIISPNDISLSQGNVLVVITQDEFASLKLMRQLNIKPEILTDVTVENATPTDYFEAVSELIPEAKEKLLKLQSEIAEIKNLIEDLTETASHWSFF